MGSSDFDLFALAAGQGALALCPLPGRSGDYLNDLRKLLDWPPDLVISLTDRSEMEAVGASRLGVDLRRTGVRWRHWPIMDFGVPAPDADWTTLETEACHVLQTSGRVLVHCKGGCGRSGMIALRLMAALGEKPDKALVRLRAVRPCAIETEAQLAWAQP